MSMKETNESIVANIKNWQNFEKEAASLMEKTIAKCDHPIVCTVMEVIRRDSELHSQVQSLIVDSFEKKPLAMGLDQFGEVVDLIRKHIEIKEKMIESTEKVVEMAKDKSLGLQRFLLTYLLEDEKKHRSMLEGVERVKRTLYPYWPH